MNVINKQAFLQKIKQIRTATNKGARAPHKPLLLLYALGRYQQYGEILLPYKKTHPRLKHMLVEYGPPVKQVKTSNPFVRLKNDGIWEVTPDIDHRTNFSDRSLLDADIHASFTKEVLDLFAADPSAITEAAVAILDNHFPETYHEELLEEVGLHIEYGIRRYRKRDSAFRQKVLAAYGEQCCVCGFQAKLHDKVVGIEAAHIKWHQAYGPDEENNGLALCSLHHRLFDKGIFTIDDDKVRVASEATGKGTFQELVLDFDKKKIRKPASSLYLPSPEFIDWHVREVFKSYQAQ
ncbi:putative restriction endonuclease [Thalassobacillus pellis]|nr:putative restriction endonuclease [Thalassobacillus pellis]